MAASIRELLAKHAGEAFDLHEQHLNGQMVKIKAKKDVMVNDARVIKTDIMAKNGVIHVIDTVLLPSDDGKQASAMGSPISGPWAGSAAPTSPGCTRGATGKPASWPGTASSRSL